MQIMASHPRMAAKMMGLLARQLFDLEQTVARAASDRVDQRLADLLLRLATRDLRTHRIQDLSQADLARMIGASRESVSRTLSRWEREGAITTGQRWVEIRDEGALRAAANG